jgi:Mg/Co/Ni transporter MgtE
MSSELQAHQTSAFPLATNVARVQLGLYAFLMAIPLVIWLFTRGPSASFAVLVSALPNLLLYLVFVWQLPKGNLWIAGVFGIICFVGFFNTISADGDKLEIIVGYIDGVLCFVGLVGVFKGFSRKATP